MRKIIYSVLLFALLSPGAAFGAFNDVTLTTSTVILAGGVNLNVSGSSAVIQSIVVSPASFDVTFANGSALTVTATGQTNIAVTTAAGVTSTFTCGSPSTLVMSATGAATVTVTPGGSCSLPNVGGVGGGSASAYAPLPIPATLALLINKGAATTSSEDVVLSISAANASEMMLSNNLSFNGAVWESYTSTKNWKLNSGNGTTSVYVRFRNLNGVISNVSTANIVLLTSQSINSVTPAISVPPSSQNTLISQPGITAVSAAPPLRVPVVAGGAAFLHNLKMGSKGDDVIKLQTFLESNGFLVLPKNMKKGYFGASTKKALKKYQKSIQLSPTGSLGPKTRAALNASLTQ